MSGGSTGERPFTDVITSVRYWLIHIITIPSVFAGGFLFVLTGLAYELFGTPRPSEYYTVKRSIDTPLINNRFRSRKELEALLSQI